MEHEVLTYTLLSPHGMIFLFTTDTCITRSIIIAFIIKAFIHVHVMMTLVIMKFVKRTDHMNDMSQSGTLRRVPSFSLSLSLSLSQRQYSDS
jgi:hypothetical protein